MDKGLLCFWSCLEAKLLCIDISCELICSNKFHISFADFEQLCRIKKIYGGGDQSFAHFTANVGLGVNRFCLSVCLPMWVYQVFQFIHKKTIVGL